MKIQQFERWSIGVSGEAAQMPAVMAPARDAAGGEDERCCARYAGRRRAYSCAHMPSARARVFECLCLVSAEPVLSEAGMRARPREREEAPSKTRRMRVMLRADYGARALPRAVPRRFTMLYTPFYKESDIAAAADA